MSARHSRRNQGMNGSPATALIADYIAAHPSCKPATWSQARTHLPTQPIPVQQPAPVTNPVLSILRPTVASL